MDSVREPARDVPVMYDVDVAVVGGGLSGVFAAIAAGRLGAKTLVIDRFGEVGGNMGPGMIVGGGLCFSPDWEHTLSGGYAGIPREFVERLDSLRDEPNRYPELANLCAWAATEMAREAGVEMLLSVYAADPIVENNVVRGLFVETKAGRIAVKAKVTIDATGEADLARRAGAAIIHYHKPTKDLEGKLGAFCLKPEHPTYYNETGIFFLIAGVDWPKYQAFEKQPVTLTEEESAWLEREGSKATYVGEHLAPALCKAEKEGEFRFNVAPTPNSEMFLSKKDMDCGSGIIGYRVSGKGPWDATDPKLVSLLETCLRDYAQRAALFFRKYVPGFERAYLLGYSSFVGWRGGPHIEAEHVLTVEEMWSGARFDDVIYCNNPEKRDRRPEAEGYDVPYRMTLPKDLDGLLVAGRGAAYQRRGHDPGTRGRPSMMALGQAVGTAAAIAAQANVMPRDVDIRKVQKQLLSEDFFLGDDARLEELGLK